MKYLTTKEHNFRYTMVVKGHVAETLIQELFLSLGYNVFHYGMERSVPGIANLLSGFTIIQSVTSIRTKDYAMA